MQKLEKQDSCHQKTPKLKKIIKVCHVCSNMMESCKDIDKCSKCGKSFLPINYARFENPTNERAFNDLFHESEELHCEDLIKGLHVIW